MGPGARATRVADLDDARWITHPAWAGAEPPLRVPVLRRAIELEAAPRSARLTVAALGVWTAAIGGKAVSPDVLEPGMSDPLTRVATATYDVTSLLRAGRNELVLQLGEGPAHVRQLPGRYTKFVDTRVAPRARVALAIEDAHGTRVLVTDASWQAMLGPTTTAHWYGGEDYDARLEPPGWLSADGTADEAWEAAAIVGEPGTGPLPWRRSAPPVRVQETLGPAALTRIGDVLVVDVGRNIAGRPVLRTAGVAPGTTFELWPSEHLDAAGRADQRSTGAPIVDRFTSAGAEAEWRPRFGYHGFRYVEVRALAPDGRPDPAALDAVRLSAERVMTDDRPVGAFACSHPTLRAVYDLVVHAAEGNLFSVPTDCPHREKLGWLEQDHLVFEPIAFAWDVRSHWADLVTHMCDAQTPEGMIPDTAPELVNFDFSGEPGYRDDVNWGSAIWRVPYLLHREYGDLEPARAAWDAGVRYLAYIDRLAGDALLDHGLADWITLDASVPRALVAGHGHVAMLDAAAALGDALGRDAEATAFRGRAAELRARMRRRFVRRARDGRLEVESDSQAAYALAMDCGLLDGDERAEAGRRLVEAVEAADGQVMVGEIALPPLVRELTRLGEHELLFRMTTRADGPGYGRMVADGLTALGEHWQGARTNGSANHVMLGYIARWITGSVAGLARDPAGIGWRSAVIAPTPLRALDAARAHHESDAGRWAVAWERAGGRVVVEATVPEGASARLVVPCGWTTRAAGRLGPGEHRILLEATGA